MSEKKGDIGCEACSWTGTIEQGPDKPPRECECGMVRRLAWSMPKPVREARVVREHLDSPLYSNPKTMGLHLFISAYWADMLAIIQALMIRHMGRPIFVTNDAEVKSVYVGSRSKQSRTDDYKGVIYNDLQDLMGTPGLMILKMDEAKGSNKALPKAFEEALKCRFNYARPLWLVSDPDSPFSQDSIAWSQPTWDLITRTCVRVEVPKILERESVQMRSLSDLFGPSGGGPGPVASAPSAGVEAPAPAPAPDSAPRKAKAGAIQAPRKEPAAPAMEEAEDDGISIYGSGIARSKQQNRGSLRRAR